MKAWIAAARPRTLPLALASIILGSFLAASVGRFSWLTFTLAALTTIFLQILSNFANDYGDAVSGKDTPDRVGPRRAVATGDLTKEAMFKAILVTALLSLVSGVWLLIEATRESGAWLFWVFLILGLLCIAAAVAYTNGKRPYGYAGYGDIAVLVFFGWVGVLGTYFLHTQSLGTWLLLPASAVGFFATGVLNINNVRDIETDAKTGKHSIPVRLGRKRAVRYHWLLLISGMACALVYSLLTASDWSAYLYVLSFPLFVLNGRAVENHTNPAELNPRLGQLALSTLVFVLLFGLGVVL
ncbi:1,4-dihydroxy-2-naphthoate polyprenyltransferase [Fibrivirga algicola]|uniref:1,4-dihydroxy-2-naphthoate octaprenyltransferase n=1 Tax=Fibrivirga algicola TaxID=2950420 RepID=A0ABX0QL20_9BACT|nr:1,4-dihydroxy-2-naphthoate polyprenyltransferase [Fibrivirga algicola]ARK12329.1 1,4-dihydroxy-2-naphthoate octaprenyltransferase [Fibrella sp. ES10-3-2-2]NID10829.1 1,4-dihydroxy-2-naphthoate polyprenyltransferase [Fibrivirga algicola]